MMILPIKKNGEKSMLNQKEIVNEILRLKKEKNAVILAHNYQKPIIQDIADFIGDSLGLAMQATKTKASFIIFCGVDFMAESAKILNPDKIVIHPDRDAQCPMAAMVKIEELRKLKEEYPDAATVAYVNTTASTKAEVDICCTSANAVKVVKSLREKEIIFIPDVNLGLYAQRFVPEKKFVFWKGYCYVHQDIIEKSILLQLKKEHPKAEILVHPECIPEVIDLADYVFSTEGMVKHIASSLAKEFIIGTERELCYRLRKENPSKKIYSVEKAVCTSMKMMTVEKVLRSLETLEPKIELPSAIIEKARVPLQKMMKIGRAD
ncbi:MAG: quinolinate synthase NadA [Candidatus Thermoplasmatota archaeon]